MILQKNSTCINIIDFRIISQSHNNNNNNNNNNSQFLNFYINLHRKLKKLNCRLWWVKTQV